MKHQRTQLAAVMFILVCAPAFGGVQRTFVSSTGLDGNPCSLAQPCRSFTAAIAQTLAGGEVYVLDTGGYGQAVINTSISIRADGVSAGVSVLSGVGIEVDAGPSDVVTLHGLLINDVSGITGIAFKSGAALHLEKVTISQCTVGLDMTAAGQLFITDSVMRENNFNNFALWVHPAGSASVTVDRTRFERNDIGVLIEDGARAVIRNSIATGNYFGFLVEAKNAPAELTLENCLSAGNHYGLSAQGLISATTPGIMRISNVTVTANQTGLFLPSLYGYILSFGNNQVYGNTTDGAPSAGISPM